MQVDPQLQLEPQAEQVCFSRDAVCRHAYRGAGSTRAPSAPRPQVLQDVADDFVENVAAFACELCRHRDGKILEAKDLQLALGSCALRSSSLLRHACLAIA